MVRQRLLTYDGIIRFDYSMWGGVTYAAQLTATRFIWDIHILIVPLESIAWRVHDTRAFPWIFRLVFVFAEVIGQFATFATFSSERALQLGISRRGGVVSHPGASCRVASYRIVSMLDPRSAELISIPRILSPRGLADLSPRGPVLRNRARRVSRNTCI